MNFGPTKSYLTWDTLENQSRKTVRSIVLSSLQRKQHEHYFMQYIIVEEMRKNLKRFGILSFLIGVREQKQLEKEELKANRQKSIPKSLMTLQDTSKTKDYLRQLTQEEDFEEWEEAPQMCEPSENEERLNSTPNNSINTRTPKIKWVGCIRSFSNSIANFIQSGCRNEAKIGCFISYF